MASHARVPRVAHRVPERHRHLVFLDDDRSHPFRAPGNQASLGFMDKSGRDATPAQVRPDRKPVDRATPAVEHGDDRSDDLATCFRHDESVGVVGHQGTDRTGVVSAAGH